MRLSAPAVAIPLRIAPTRWIPATRPVLYKWVSRVPPTGVGRWSAVSRIVGFLFLALIVWMIVTQPTTAANIVNDIAAILKTAATNITYFFAKVLD